MNVKGISIQIGAETKQFRSGISELNKSSKNLQTELKAVNAALKHDPKNVELLQQKQELLTKSVSETEEKLEVLRKAKEKADKDMADGTAVNQDQYRKLVREISSTENQVESLKKEVATFGSVSKQQMQEVAESVSKVGSKFESAGKKMAPVSGIVAAVGAAAVLSAADLEATEAKYKTVFGEFVEQSDAFIAEFQKLTPATKAETQSLASGMQDLLVPLGFAREEATNMTGEFLYAAGALTNFNSATETAETVMTKINAAITGEYSSLKSLGVQLDSDTVKRKALEMGLISSTDEFDKQVAAQVVLAEIYAQSGDALAAYNEESLDTKTKTELLKADIQDLSAEIGMVMLPIVTQIIDAVREWVAKFSQMDDGTKKTIVVVGLAVAAIAPLLIIIGNVISAVAAIIAFVPTLTAGLAAVKIAVAAIGGPITIVFGLISLLIAKFVLTYNTSEEFRDKVNAAFDNVKETVTNVVNSVVDKVKEFREIGKNVMEGLWNGIGDKVEWLKSKVTGVVDSIKGVFTGKNGFDTHSPSKWAEKIMGWTMQGLANGAKNDSSAVNAVRGAVSGIKRVFVSAVEESQRSVEEITSDIDTLHDKLNNYGDLFSITVDDDGNNMYQLSALENYIEMMEEYEKTINTLKAKGLSSGLIEEMSNMSIEDAMGFGGQLLEMSDDEFVKYNLLWEEKQRKAKTIAENIYKTELETLSGDFNSELDSELSVIKDTTLGVGVDSIKSLVAGMFSQEGYAVSAAKELGTKIGESLAMAKSEAGGDADGSHRNGLSYVPFDGYRAILHEGERVLTKAEAQKYSNTTRNETKEEFNVYIEKVVNSSGRDVQDFNRELEFWRQSKTLAKGGV